MCYTAAFGPLIAKESEAQARTQQIARVSLPPTNLHLHTKKLNDTFISRMYMYVNYYVNYYVIAH